MPSPNDMMVDTEEHIVEPTANDAEKDSLTIINPDNLETETEQLQDLPRADDCMCIQEIAFLARDMLTQHRRCYKRACATTFGGGTQNTVRYRFHMEG